MRNAVCVVSGGQDSVTCLAWAKKHYDYVTAITFHYGQRHHSEIEAAVSAADHFKVSHRIFQLPILHTLTENALTRHDEEITTGQNGLPTTFVDGRNHLFLSIAAIYTKQRGFHDIITGVCQTDFSGYPDCRDVFIKSLNVTLNLAMDYQFNIVTPLMYLNKAQTWGMAYDLGILDYIKGHTVTCYQGIIGDGCGECPACRLRATGYRQFKKGNYE